MNKICFLVSTFLFTGFFSSAQNVVTDTSAPCVAYWKKGDKKSFTITKKVDKTENGKVISTNTTRCSANLTVTDSTAEGYTIEWIYKYPTQTAKPGLENLFNDLKVIYKVDDVGSFKEVINYEEMKGYLEKSLRALTSNAKDTTGMSMVISQVRNLFSSRESVEQLLLREISLYHTPFGVEYSVNKTVTETELPNFLGEDPWPALLSMRLAPRPTPAVAQIIMDLEIDKVKAAENINKFLKRFTESLGKSIPENELPNYLEIKDHYQFDLVLETGWIKTASVKRVANYGGKGKIETTVLQLN